MKAILVEQRSFDMAFAQAAHDIQGKGDLAWDLLSPGERETARVRTAQALVTLDKLKQRLEECGPT